MGFSVIQSLYFSLLSPVWNNGVSNLVNSVTWVGGKRPDAHPISTIGFSDKLTTSCKQWQCILTTMSPFLIILYVHSSTCGSLIISTISMLSHYNLYDVLYWPARTTSWHKRVALLKYCLLYTGISDRWIRLAALSRPRRSPLATADILPWWDALWMCGAYFVMDKNLFITGLAWQLNSLIPCNHNLISV